MQGNRMSYFKPGTYNVVCDVCGMDFKSDEVKTRWDGAIVCFDDYEPRHMSDLLRVRREKPDVPWTVPEPDDVFIDVPYIEI
jgi:hypothetical protein